MKQIHFLFWVCFFYFLCCCRFLMTDWHFSFLPGDFVIFLNIISGFKLNAEAAIFWRFEVYNLQALLYRPEHCGNFIFSIKQCTNLHGLHGLMHVLISELCLSHGKVKTPLFNICRYIAGEISCYIADIANKLWEYIFAFGFACERLFFNKFNFSTAIQSSKFFAHMMIDLESSRDV